MTEERRRILNMLAAGKISADEADALLDALNKRQRAGGGPAESPRVIDKKDLKYMRVTVESLKGDNVNVKVPLAVLRAGIKLSALVPKQAYAQINQKIAEQGFAFDISSIKPDDLEQLIDALSELNVDVNSAQGDKVRVFFE